MVSLGGITLLFALIFKYLPDVEIHWNDVWFGAFITALLFTCGKLLLGFYLGRSSMTSVYSGAGSLIIVLIWIYYSAQIFLFGAEFTQVHANRGSAPSLGSEGQSQVLYRVRAAQKAPKLCMIGKFRLSERRISQYLSAFIIPFGYKQRKER